MEVPVDQLSHEELLAQHLLVLSDREAMRQRLTMLEHQLEQLKRLVFGAKRERFIAQEPAANQLPLFQQLPAEPPSAEPARQQVSYERSRPKQQPKRRQEFPAHLPREVIIIQPEEPVKGLKQIGEEVTETLDYQAAKLIVIRRIRPKYVDPGNEERGVIIAPAPERPFAKSIAEVGLVAQILIDKFVDHLPLYRLAKRFRRMGLDLSDSVLGDLVEQAFVLLFPLWERLQRRVVSQDYLQVDETTIRVQKVKKGKTHQGYFWGYHAPPARLAFFEYEQSRERAGPAERLKKYRGYIQSDAYVVYDMFDMLEHVTGLNCWAHVRRKFFEAQSNDPSRAREALSRIQKLYAVEDRLREAADTEDYAGLRLRQRQEKAVPALEQLHAWLEENLPYTLPQSPIGVAVGYALRHWKKLLVYTTDGRLEIDNNLMENQMRPIALGRKNYLFAGSPDGARRAALFYSLLSCCQLNGINPDDYLYDVLSRIGNHPVNRLDELLPDQWQPLNKTGEDGQNLQR